VPRLLITRDDGVQRQASLARSTVRLGRDPQADICLEDPGKGVSRFHAEIRYESGGYTIVDLESRNGTIVNGKRVAQARLTPGSVVNVGPYELRFEGGDAPPADDPGYTVISPPPQRYQAPGRDAAPPPVPQHMPGGRSGPRPQTLLLGAAIAIVAVIAIVAIVRIYNRPPTVEDGPPGTPPVAGGTTTPPRPGPPPPPPPGRPTGRLADADSLITGGQPERALNEIINPILKEDPTNAEAQRLRRKAEDKIIELVKGQRASPKPSPPPPPAAPPRPKPAAVPDKPPADANAIPRRTGENQVDYNTRVQRIKQQYAAAHSAIDKGEFLDAIGQLEALQHEQPGYLDSSKLLAEVQQRRQDEARRALDAATKAEESGALLDALAALERARRYDPSPAIDQRITRVHERMKEEGAKAYNDARKLDAFGRTQDAIGLYRRALSLLPADDDRRKEAVKRLEALAK
jgi:hypothetical protein